MVRGELLLHEIASFVLKVQRNNSNFDKYISMYYHVVKETKF